jgi:hypothetical protein
MKEKDHKDKLIQLLDTKIHKLENGEMPEELKLKNDIEQVKFAQR